MSQGSREESHYTFDRVVRFVISAATLAAVVWLLRYLSDVLLPFVVAIVLAYLLNPIVALLERRTRRRGLAVALTLVGMAVVGGAVLGLVIPLAFSQVNRFRTAVESIHKDLATAPQTATAAPPDTSIQEAPDTQRTTGGWREFQDGWRQYRQDAGRVPRSERLARLRQQVAGTYAGALLDGVIAYAASDDFKLLIAKAIKGLLAGGWTALALAVQVVLGLVGLILVLVYLVFLLLDYPQLERAWPGFLPPKYREPIVEFLVQFNTALQQYFRGQALVALLTGTLYAVGFTLIGLPMAVPMGLFVGLLNMVPYLPTVALVPAAFLAALRSVETDSSLLVSCGLLLLVVALVQVTQDAFITPRVMGRATGLRPVAILPGLFIWGKLLGFLGLILAIPLTCLGIAYYRRYVLHQPEPAPAAPGGSQDG